MVKFNSGILLLLIILSSTLERSIAIFGMIIGVTSFYFVISDINTIISNSVEKGMKFSFCMAKLEKIQKKYLLSNSVYKKARMSIFNSKPSTDASWKKWFLDQFPMYLQNELKYHIYSKMFSCFEWTSKLTSKTLNLLGDSIREVEFEESKIN
jgi:hypothetical protein